MPKGIRANNLQIAEIIHLYTKEHIPYNQIATHYKATGATIRQLLCDNNITIGDSSHRINVDATELNRLYTIEHLTSEEVGSYFGVSFTCILKKLKDNNIPIRPKHGNPFTKTRIKLGELPSLIRKPKIINHNLTGNVTCPMCGKTRRLHLTRPRIKDIVNSNGKCTSCATKARTIPMNPEIIKQMYERNHLTPKEISTNFNVSSKTVYAHMKRNGIHIRAKGKTRALIFKDMVHRNNEGTLDSPIIGDICRGLEIGLNNKSYYIRIACPKCHQERWQEMSKVKKYPFCKDCAVDPTLNNRGTIDNPIVGDIRRGSEVGKRGRFYKWVSCPECNRERWEPKNHARKLHLCKDCASRIRGLTHRKEKSGGWRGGGSQEPYNPDFNFRLKEQIRKRDHYTCQICGISQNGTRLAIHHIDYIKQHNHPNNLISLCPNYQGSNFCHLKTNNNREYWTVYFNKLLKERGVLVATS